MEKTTVFNLIILDESGSMGSLTKQTVDGCNETLNLIRSLQEKYGDTQRHLVSIYLFQSDAKIPSRYVCKNVPVEKVENMTTDIYKPWGCTPLLDAVGSTLTDLRAVASTHTDSTGIVTIITDGMENSSTDYTYDMVANLISKLKELGWTFNFIGANIDVDMVSKKMNIDNAMAFQASAKGTKNMWQTFGACMMESEEARVANEMACPEVPMEERIQMRKRLSKMFFSK